MPKSSLDLALQFSIRLIKRNDALDSTISFENTILADAKTGAASSVVNRLLFAQEHRLKCLLLSLRATAHAVGSRSTAPLTCSEPFAVRPCSIQAARSLAPSTCVSVALLRR
jgi:hypothetical protein